MYIRRRDNIDSFHTNLVLVLFCLIARMQVENICQYNLQNNKMKSLDENDCPEELKEDIKLIIKSEKFIKFDVKITKLPVDGGNYLAELYEIDVDGITEEGQKEIHLFAKQLKIGSGDLKDMIDIQGIYKNEKFAYIELYEVFDELQENAKVPIDEKYKMAKCYKSNPSVILMDNLCKRGFQTYSRLDCVSIDFAELAIVNLAKLHALSFAVEKFRPDYFDSKLKTLKYPVKFCDEWKGFQNSMFSTSMSCLGDDLRSRVEKTILTMLDSYTQYFESTEVMCICHGDYRVMNMMIRYDGDKVADLIALDYQLMYYGNPILDFMYFIFTATDRKLRKSHLSDLKETYYKTIEKFLKYMDVDIEDVFPRTTFEKIYEETLDFGLLTIASVAPILLVDSGDVPDVTKVSMSNLNVKVHDVFKDRVREVIEDFIEWGRL